MKFLKTTIVGLLISSVSFLGFTQEFSYQIKGKIKGLKNDTLVCTTMDNLSGERKSFKIFANNDTFSFAGKAPAPALVFAQIANSRKDGNFTFFLDMGAISIQGNRNELEGTIATGTPINNDYSAGNKILYAYYNKRDSIFKKMETFANKNDNEYRSLLEQVSKINAEILAFQLHYIADNPASMFSAMQLYVLSDKISTYELETYFNALKSPAKNLALLKDIPRKIAAKKLSEIGKPAPLFSIKDTKGNLINLSDYRGKYVLLDFWASWCVPCRKENPGLVKAYKLFKDKPFEIISVSADENEPNWKKAIIADHLQDWIHVSDLKGTKSDIALLYGVQPIPDNFLIDPEGNIIGRGLFGDRLETRLRSLLNK